MTEAHSALQAGPYLKEALALAREGFGGVNGPLGLLIALIVALMMRSYRQILIVAFVATLVHLAAQSLIPVVASHAAFALPPLLSSSFWREAGVLFIGYIIVIFVLYSLRRALLKPAH